MPEIGATLQEARMRAGIDISEVETATKIRAKYLRAMENEEWDLLPGPTFVKTFLRTYAEYLGIDAKLLVDEYKLRHEQLPEHEPQPISPGLGAAPRTRLRAPVVSRGWIIGLSVAGVLGLLILLGSLSEEDPRSLPTPTRPASTVARPASPPPKPTRVALRLAAREEVYACLRDAAGELVLNQTLLPSDGERAFSGRRFRLTVGRAAIRVLVNGKRLPVPDAGEPVTWELKPGSSRRLPGVNACEGG
jgi:hypothetical protein